MRVKERLRLLRPAPAGESAAPAAAESGLRASLKRYGEIRDRAGFPAGQPADDDSLARLVGGRVLAKGVVLIREQLPLGQKHGDRPMRPPDVAGLQALGFADASNASSLLYLDTETTGLSSGTGTLVFLLGLASIRRQHIEIDQYLLSMPHGEQAMLERAQALVNGHDILVTYNGRSFDVPLLSTRCRMGRLSDPYAGLRQLDLLHPTRRAFQRQWPDCRLQTAERRLLGLLRHGDLPGSEAPAAWLEWIRQGSVAKLKAICRHNRTDLLSLIALCGHLAELYCVPRSAGFDVVRVARGYLRDGDRVRARACLEATAADLDEIGLLLLAQVHRALGDWRRAVPLWEHLATTGSTAAQLALAKYHEHVRRDYSMALAFTEDLLNVQGASGELARRKARLQARRRTSIDSLRRSGALDPNQYE